jgi:hypothetical protein
MEREPQTPEHEDAETVDTVEFSGQPLHEWQRLLAQYEDEHVLRDGVVVSRYGDTVADCAWWGLAGAIVASRADMNFNPLRFYRLGIRMTRDAVADDPDLYELVHPMLDDLYPCLVAKLNEPIPPTDEYLIWDEIGKAQMDGVVIDDATARMIAAHLHGGQNTALYTFASTGAITAKMAAELRESMKPEEHWTMAEWAKALTMYAFAHHVRGPVEGWNKLWLERPTLWGED